MMMHRAFIRSTGETLIGEANREFFYTLRDRYTGEADIFRLGEEAVLLTNEPDPSGDEYETE